MLLLADIPELMFGIDVEYHCQMNKYGDEKLLCLPGMDKRCRNITWDPCGEKGLIVAYQNCWKMSYHQRNDIQIFDSKKACIEGSNPGGCETDYLL